jgi:hypothetical protein
MGMPDFSANASLRDARGWYRGAVQPTATSAVTPAQAPCTAGGWCGTISTGPLCPCPPGRTCSRGCSTRRDCRGELVSLRVLPSARLRPAMRSNHALLDRPDLQLAPKCRLTCHQCSRRTITIAARRTLTRSACHDLAGICRRSVVEHKRRPLPRSPQRASGLRGVACGRATGPLRHPSGGRWWRRDAPSAPPLPPGLPLLRAGARWRLSPVRAAQRPMSVKAMQRVNEVP